MDENRTKVLMFGWEFPPFNSGGLGTACYGLTKSLYHNGVVIKFVLPKKLPIQSDFIKLVSSDIEVNIINSTLRPYMTPNDYDRHSKEDSFYGNSLFDEVERYAIKARDIAVKEDFDVIHAHDWLTFKAGVEAKKISGKPLVVHVHATEFDRTGGNSLNQHVYEIERYGMEQADAVIAVSNFTKEKIVKHYGIDPNKIHVIHNGVEFTQYGVNSFHPIRRNNKIVLFVGRITLQKGPDYFLYAARRVLDYYPDAYFIIVGSGDMESFIINKAIELGIANRILFAGFLREEELEKVYKMADLYVMPSVSEPFGIAPLEALMHGTPVLISKQSGVSEVLNHCVKTDFWDIDEMCNKIVSILKYSPLRDELKENGVIEVKKCNWDHSAKKCIHVYNEMLKRKS